MARKKKAMVAVQKPFRVMDLPPEIRNRIWEFAVVTHEPIQVKDHKRSAMASKRPPSSLRSGKQIESHRKDDIARTTAILTIAFACRQVYLEVTPIYYSKNTFQFRGCCYVHPPTLKFTKAIGKEKAQSITSVILEIEVLWDLPDISSLPGLKRLDVQRTTGWFKEAYDGPGYISLANKMSCKTKENPDLLMTIHGEPWQRYLPSADELSNQRHLRTWKNPAWIAQHMSHHHRRRRPSP